MTSLCARIYVHPAAGSGGVGHAAALYDGRRLELWLETSTGPSQLTARRCTLSLDAPYALGGEDMRATLSDFDPDLSPAEAARNATFILLDGEQVVASGTVIGAHVPGATTPA
jgi:hypothetical protein